MFSTGFFSLSRINSVDLRIINKRLWRNAMKLLLTGGGTAGHVIPCLALVDYVNDYFDEIYFVGGNGEMERNLLKNYPKIKYFGLDAPKLKRSLSPDNLALPFRLAGSVREAKNLLKALRPDVVFSKGGYASLPISLATDAPLIAHESDYSVGLANRLIKRKSKVFCCGFEDTAIQNNGVYTGIPLRKEIYHGKKLHLFFGSKPVLLVMGGSLGAKAINEAVLSNLDALKSEFNVIHIVGNCGEARQEQGYIAQKFAFNMADLYATADFVLSRGGATALAEIVSLKKPSLIIPLPKGASRGDQIVNAKYYQKQGLTRVLAQENIANLVSELSSLRRDEALKSSLLSAKSVDGAQKIAQILKNATAGIFTVTD